MLGIPLPDRRLGTVAKALFSAAQHLLKERGMNPTACPMFTGRLIDLLQSVRWQFDQAPDTSMTVSEAERLWPIGPHRLVALFETFVDVGFLQREGDGVYRRRAEMA